MQAQLNPYKQITRVMNMNFYQPPWKNVFHLKKQQNQNQAQYPQTGNLYIGSIGSIKPQIIKQHKITAIVSVINRSRYQTYNLQEKILDYLFSIKLDLKKQEDIQKFKDKKINKIMEERHLWIDIDDKDSANISKHFQKAHQFIKKNFSTYETNDDLKMKYGIFQGINAKKNIKNKNKLKEKDQKVGGNVLIHCMGGVSRSATILISFLIKQLFLKNKLFQLEADIQKMQIVQKILKQQEKQEYQFNKQNQFPDFEDIIRQVTLKHQFTRPNNGFQKQLRTLYNDLKYNQ